MKKFLVLFLVIIMVCHLAACTENAANSRSPVESQEPRTPQEEEPANVASQDELPEQMEPVEEEYPKLTGETGVYKAGLYEVTTRGLGGNIVFHITFSTDAITQIEAVKHHETAGIGDKALEQLIPTIIEAQNTQVDGWSGATITSDAIKEAVNTAIEEALA